VPLRMGGGRFNVFEPRPYKGGLNDQRRRGVSEDLAPHTHVGIVILLAHPGTGWVDRGVEAFHLGDYVTAYREFLPLAQQGDARGQFGIGGMYYDGLDRPQDYVQAVKWFSLAAAQGLAVAHLLLGTQIQKGQGVPQDYAQALIWFRLALPRERLMRSTCLAACTLLAMDSPGLCVKR